MFQTGEAFGILCQAICANSPGWDMVLTSQLKGELKSHSGHESGEGKTDGL
jgi:hypothetical protein